MEKIKQFIEELNYSYLYDEKKDAYRLRFNLPGKLNQCEIIINSTETFTKFYGIISISANKESLAEVAEFITRANYGLLIGNFEMDYNDGEIRYKIVVDKSFGGQINKNILDDYIGIIVSMYAKYGEGLLKVIFGFSTAEDAVTKIENE